MRESLSVILLDPENGRETLDGGVELLRVPLTSSGRGSEMRVGPESGISQRRDERLTRGF